MSAKSFACANTQPTRAAKIVQFHRISVAVLVNIASVVRILCADVDEASKQKLKLQLQKYDRTLLVADPRRCEAKK